MSRMRNLGIAALAAIAVAVPSFVGPATASDAWAPGTPVLTGAYTDPWVLVTPEGLVRLYYADVNNNGWTFAATSANQGASFPKAPTTPVFANSTDGIVVRAFRTSEMTDFCDSNNGYRAWLVAKSDGSIKMAIGADALAYDTCSKGGLTVGGETPTVGAIGDPAVVQLSDGTWLMAYVGYDTATPSVRSIYYATSDRGLVWSKKGLAVAGASAPMLVIWDDGSVRLYMKDAKGIEHTTYSAGTFSATATLDLADTNATDPMVVKYNLRWHMFYTLMSGTTATGIYDAVGPTATGTAPSPTVKPVDLPSSTATPTATPTASPTATPTATPTASPTATATPTPTATPTESATPSPTASVQLYFVKCTDGTTIKYRTGTNPMCPVGWRWLYKGEVKA